MLSAKRLMAALVSGLMIGGLCVDRALVGAAAQTYDAGKATLVTFTKPIRLPGVTLPAGTYEFVHPTAMVDFHVVQVFSKDGTKMFGTFLTIPDKRLTPANETVVTFHEAPAGAINAARAWFFPGDTIGDEFLYSKKEAREIAQQAHEAVLTMPDATRTDEKGQVQRATPSKASGK